MKKILLTTFTFCITLITYAQSTVISDRLQFAGTNTLNTSLTQGQIISYNWGSLQLASRSNAAGKHISFHTGIGAIERLRILDNGNVGIGTTSPLAKLDVNGDIFTYGILKSSKSGAGGAQLRLVNTYGASEDWRIQAGIAAISDNTFAIQTISNSVTRFAIKNNGNVGIGTSSPSEKLEVYNSTTTPGVLSLKSQRNDFQHVDVGRISAKQSTVEVARIGLPRAGHTNSGYLTFWTKEDNSASLSEKVRIRENGNVGIGTTSPTEKLSVGGNILAKKVRVSIAAADWPDYVFTPSYELRALSELESYIKLNQHLPEVPSAKEVVANGLDLGDMDATLLKKVEELTLYLIQENKDKTALQKENKALKYRLSKIEAILKTLTSK